VMMFEEIESTPPSIFPVWCGQHGKRAADCGMASALFFLPQAPNPIHRQNLVFKSETRRCYNANPKH